VVSKFIPGSVRQGVIPAITRQWPFIGLAVIRRINVSKIAGTGDRLAHLKGFGTVKDALLTLRTLLGKVELSFYKDQVCPALKAVR